MHEDLRTVRVDGRNLTCGDVERVALGTARAILDDGARAVMTRSAELYVAEGRADVLRSKWKWLLGGEPPASSSDVVRLFVQGHCAGVGDPLPPEEVRALILARANVLAGGWSGVRPVVVERLLELLERDWTPVVPEIGEVGAAGSIQLAHVAWVAFGFGGEVLIDGVRERAPARIATLPPLVPTEKETLSLLNGSSWTTALAALATVRAWRMLRTAEAACALSFEVVKADLNALSVAAAAARGQRGTIDATARLRELVAGSALVTAQRSPDSFSVRCAPLVLGAARDALAYIEDTVLRDLNAPNDNPLVFPDEGIVEAGHFHAAAVGLVMDHLKAAMTQVASISERRIFRLTYGRLSGLPSFLVPGSGVNSGLMLAQYTAASVLAEAKALCMPASIDSIPTVQHQEDHVSMGPVAARSALEVVDRVADVLSIELLCAAQGLEFRLAGRALGADGALIDVEPQEPGAGTRLVFDRVREHVQRWDDDQVLHTDLVAIGAAVREGAFSH